MNDQEKRNLVLEYARLAVQAKRRKEPLPTDPMKEIYGKLGMDHIEIIHQAIRYVKYS